MNEMFAERVGFSISPNTGSPAPTKNEILDKFAHVFDPDGSDPLELKLERFGLNDKGHVVWDKATKAGLIKAKPIGLSYPYKNAFVFDIHAITSEDAILPGGDIETSCIDPDDPAKVITATDDNDIPKGSTIVLRYYINAGVGELLYKTVETDQVEYASQGAENPMFQEPECDPIPPGCE